MPAAIWPPDGDKLRDLREARDLSQRQFARLAKVDAETVADIEAGKRHRVRSATLRKLAPPLLVEWEDLVRDYKGRRKLVPRRLAEELLPRSSLDLLRYAEEEEREPPVETAWGKVEIFGVAELVDTFAAPRTREGDRYCVIGEVAHQRGLYPGDEAILDVEPLEGARFEIVRKFAESLPPFSLTVFSKTLAHTRAL
jgi:transcriptional regulator with XRE-family HTH domain